MFCSAVRRVSVKNHSKEKKRVQVARGVCVHSLGGWTAPRWCRVVSARSLRIQGHADLEQELNELLVQRDEKVGLPDEFRKAAGLERGDAAGASHASGEAAPSSQEAAGAAVHIRRVHGGCRR